MHQTELRIGNITDKGIIKCFYEGGIHVGMGKCFKYSELKPIPLSDEWMIKLGFKKVKMSGVYWFEKKLGKNKPILITNDIGEFAFSKKLKFAFMDIYDNIQFKYVHQIQNIVFALTKTEIKIK